jgi:hypothetical protein
MRIKNETEGNDLEPHNGRIAAMAIRHIRPPTRAQLWGLLMVSAAIGLYAWVQIP